MPILLNVIGQFLQNFKEIHLHTAYKVQHYLKGTPGKGILFKKNNGIVLEAYVNTNYDELIVSIRSTIDYCTFFGRNFVTWRNKKHNVLVRSSAESKFGARAK